MRMRARVKLDAILATTIILTAIAVRFYHLDLKMRFIWDEGRDMMAIHNIVANKDLTLFGPYNEIGGKKDFFGVFHYYLMAPALWLANYDPIGPAALTAGLGVLSVGLLYWLIRKNYSKQVALGTTALYAVSPLVVHYVQWPWNPNTTPFFALLFFCALERLKTKKSMLWSGTAGLLLGLAFQLHYFTIALGFAWLLTILRLPGLSKLKQKVIHGAGFVVGFVLPNLSFVLFDFTHEHFYWNIVRETLAGGGQQQYLTPTISSLVFGPVLYLQTVIEGLFAIQSFPAVLLAILFLVWVTSKIIARKPDLAGWLSVSWLGMLVLAGLFPQTVNDYHSNYLWFGILLFTVLLIEKIVRSVVRNALLYIIVGLCIYLLIQIQLFRQPNWSENMPLVRDLSNSIVAEEQQTNADHKKTIEVAALTDADTRAVRYRYFLVAGGVYPLAIDKYPEADVLYVISPHSESESKKNPAWELQSFVELPWEEIADIQGTRVFRVEKP